MQALQALNCGGVTACCSCYFSSTEFHTRGRLKQGSPYSITERRVPGLIPVPGSQPAGDVSHKPGGR